MYPNLILLAIDFREFHLNLLWFCYCQTQKLLHCKCREKVKKTVKFNGLVGQSTWQRKWVSHLSLYHLLASSALPSPHANCKNVKIYLLYTPTCLPTCSRKFSLSLRCVSIHTNLHSHAYTVWMYSCMLTCTDTGIQCMHTFHISAVMFPRYKDLLPSRVLQNNWWMVTQPGWSLHGWPCLTCCNMGPFTSNPNHWVENIRVSPDCPGMAS